MTSVRFAHPVEEEIVRVFDELGIARKARHLGVSVEVLSRNDIEKLADRWKLTRLAHAARARPMSVAARGATE
jgi:4-hydroxyphenylpyruvate dioxygenase-like putative hemolysin